jgi:hypothetical protein
MDLLFSFGISTSISPILAGRKQGFRTQFGLSLLKYIKTTKKNVNKISSRIFYYNSNIDCKEKSFIKTICKRKIGN